MTAWTKSSDTYPALAGVVQPGGLATNSAVLGLNQITNSRGYLGQGDMGVYGRHPDPTKWAGYFDGNVHVTQSLLVGTIDPSARVNALTTDGVAIQGVSTNFRGVYGESGVNDGTGGHTAGHFKS